MFENGPKTVKAKLTESSIEIMSSVDSGENMTDSTTTTAATNDTGYHHCCQDNH